MADEREGIELSLPVRPLAALLRESRVGDWDTRVLYQLLEFQYRTTKQVLNGAKQCSLHRGGRGLLDRDVRLALELEEENTPFRRPSNVVAKRINSIGIPKVSQGFLRLPRNAFINDELVAQLVEEEPEAVSDAPSAAAPVRTQSIAAAEPGSEGSMYNIKRRKALEIRAPSVVAGVTLKR
jgi:hypothetical protein